MFVVTKAIIAFRVSMSQVWNKNWDKNSKIMTIAFLSHVPDLLFYLLSVFKLFKCPGGVLVQIPNLLRSLMKALPSRQAYFSK